MDKYSSRRLNFSKEKKNKSPHTSIHFNLTQKNCPRKNWKGSFYICEKQGMLFFDKE